MRAFYMPRAGLLTAGGTGENHCGAGRAWSITTHARLAGHDHVRLRAMTTTDVEAGLRLCRQSHWNQIARDWEQFLRLTPHGAVVAEHDDGTVVGSVATMRYGRATGANAPATPQRASGERAHAATPPHVAWIAMVLVEPAFRGQGIGTALLQRGLEALADVPIVGLDATPLGRPLYETMGFRMDAGMTRLTRVSGVPVTEVGGPSRIAVRQAHAGDLDAIAAVDAATTGLDRRAMLAWLLDGAPELAWVASRGGPVEGVILGRPGHQYTHLGPVLARSTDMALRLLRACLAHAPQPRVVVDAADAHASWRDGLEALGFTAQRPFARMYRGAERPAAEPAHLFAIIGPEFG